MGQYWIGRDIIFAMMHICLPIYCPMCSRGAKSVGHELDTPIQTQKMEKGDSCAMIRNRALCKKYALCMQKKTAETLASALGRFLLPHIDVGSIINDVATHLRQY